VLTASIVGGTLGGTIVRSRPMIAALVAIGTAWPVGIGMLSITAHALDISLRTGIYCIDTCSVSITSLQPLSGLGAYATSVVWGMPFGSPIGSGILLLVAWWLGRHHRYLAGVVVTIAAYAFLHMWSVLSQGLIAFACLAVGVVISATLLHRIEKRDLVEHRDSEPSTAANERASRLDSATTMNPSCVWFWGSNRRRTPE
jgi:hypothetical protein